MGTNTEAVPDRRLSLPLLLARQSNRAFHVRAVASKILRDQDSLSNAQVFYLLQYGL